MEFSGPATRLTTADFQVAAAAKRLDVALIKAVIAVEASPKGGFLADGRPLILFEARHFDSQTGGQFRQSYPNLSSATWDRSLYAHSSVAEWDRLTAAIALNRAAALQSASWGLFQVMGFNFAACGQSGIESFVRTNVASEAGQLDIFLAFLDSNPAMARALREHRWDDFAAAYNGPQYLQNNYAVKLAAAFRDAVVTAALATPLVLVNTAPAVVNRSEPLAPPPPPPPIPAPVPPPVVLYTRVVTPAWLGVEWWRQQTPDSPIPPGTPVTVLSAGPTWSDVTWSRAVDGATEQGWVDSSNIA